jgi:hypothetical protein
MVIAMQNVQKHALLAIATFTQSVFICLNSGSSKAIFAFLATALLIKEI